MTTTQIKQAFQAIGADVDVETTGWVFDIDVRQTDQRKVYQLNVIVAPNRAPLPTR